MKSVIFLLLFVGVYSFEHNPWSGACMNGVDTHYRSITKYGYCGVTTTTTTSTSTPTISSTTTTSLPPTTTPSVTNSPRSVSSTDKMEGQSTSHSSNFLLLEMSFKMMLFYMLLLVFSSLHPTVANDVEEYEKTTTQLPKTSYQPKIVISEDVSEGQHLGQTVIHEEEEKESHCIDNPNVPFDPKSVEFHGPSQQDSIIVEVFLKDSMCLSTMTTTSFDLYMGVLSRNNILLEVWKVESTMLERDEETRTIAGRVSFPAHGLNKCFQKTPKVCAPSAEVLFVKYKGLPVDKALSIEYIEFSTHVRFGKNKHSFEGRHDILLPCTQLMDQVGFYQVGPRTGLFLHFPIDKEPKIGEVVRDWV